MVASVPEGEEFQRLIERLGRGEPAAREELIRQACGRLQRLARKMLKGFPGVRRWAQTDDVLQGALLRLWRALADVHPGSVPAFFGLASQQIRRELLDLARHYYGPEGTGANHASSPDGEGLAPEKSDNSLNPGALAEWTELHRQVEMLPEKEREVFGLLYYQGRKQREAAGVLGVDESTVQRRWLSALRKLRQTFKGELPGL